MLSSHTPILPLQPLARALAARAQAATKAGNTGLAHNCHVLELQVRPASSVTAGLLVVLILLVGVVSAGAQVHGGWGCWGCFPCHAHRCMDA